MNYMTFSTLFARGVLLAALLSVLGVPFSVSAAPAGTIHTSSLTAVTTSKPTLSGAASDVTTLRVTIYKAGSTKVFYKSRSIKVRDEKWKARISKKLPDGTYRVTVSSTKGPSRGEFITGTLVVNKRGKTPRGGSTLAVSSVPLLFGGMAQGGTSVPVAYLQITNTGEKEVSVKGFWVKQNGTAPAAAIIGLTTVDDQGGSRGSAGGLEGASPFKNDEALAPTDVLFAPGQMRLFTVKAVLSSFVTASLGKQIMIDVTGIETDALLQGQFPLRGTTWTISN